MKTELIDFEGSRGNGHAINYVSGDAAVDDRRTRPDPEIRITLDDWSPLIPLSDFGIPEFPVDVLPDRFRSIVEGMAETTGTAVAWCAVGALTLYNATAARRMRVHVNENYQEPMSLYTLFIGESGTRKSALFEKLMAPIRAYETSLIRRAEPLIDEAQTERDLAERRLQILRNRAARAEPDECRKYRELIHESQAALRALQVPAKPCLVCDNVTGERLRSDLAMQGRLILASAEGGDQLAVFAGRYAGKPHFDVLLNGDSEDYTDVKRMGREERIERPALSVVLGIQPSVLTELAAVRGVIERGLLNRFVFAWAPADLSIGDPAAFNAELRERYRDDLTELFTHIVEPTSVGEPHALRLSAGAHEAYGACRARLESRRFRDGETHRLTGAISKLQGRVLRLAGALHLASKRGAKKPWLQSISPKTMESAVRLVEDYVLPTTEMTFGRVNADPALEAAKRLWRNIRSLDAPRFTRNQLWNQVKNGQFPKSRDMDAGLQVLVDHGHIRQRSRETRNGAGRPAQIYDINPAALAH